MSLKQQLTEEMKTAMRARDMFKLGVIRFLLSDIKNFEIDHGEQDDQGILKIIAKQIKQMNDAIADFKKGDRQDLVDAESKKVEILAAYLPAQLSDEQLRQLVQEAISTADDKSLGKIMPAVLARVKGQADGQRVAAMVKELL